MNPLIQLAMGAVGGGGGAEAIAANIAQQRASDAMLSKDELQAKRDMATANKQVESQNKQMANQLTGLQNPMMGLNEGLGMLQIKGSAATTIVTSLGNVLGNIPIIGPQIQQLANAFGMLEGQLKGLNQFVAGFSPFDSKLLDKAFADLNAAFGEQLVPVIRAGTEVVRWFGDTLAGWTPIIRPLIEQGLAKMAPLFQILGDAARDSLNALTPLLPVIEEALASLGDPANAEAMEEFGKLMVEFVRMGVSATVGLVELNKTMGQTTYLIDMLVFGLKNLNAAFHAMAELNPLMKLGRDNQGPELDPNYQGASQNKAAVSTGTSSPEALLTKMQAAAFGMSEAAKTTDNTGKTAGFAESMARDMSTLLRFFQNDFAGSLNKATGGLVSESQGKQIESVGKQAYDMFNRIKSSY